MLREELTQTLGLQNDSYQYPNSVFQEDPQYTPVAYSSVDEEVIRLLYDQKIKPGMNGEQVRKALIVKQPVSSVAGNYTGPATNRFKSFRLSRGSLRVQTGIVWQYWSHSSQVALSFQVPLPS